MGCDIHTFIEYKSGDRWSNFGDRMNPGRNYLMFGALAGVRCDDVPHIEPRGVPKDIAYITEVEFTLFISLDLTEEQGYCSREQADRWLASGSSLPWDERRVTHPDWHTPSWLTSDEFELVIATYLKRSGFTIGALRLTGPESMSDNQIKVTDGEYAQEAKWALNGLTEYWAILTAMRCFEAQGKPARLVFWFDN